jgi:3-phenylpropionate/cinnamic acid dioxygenase small subunit
MAAAALVHGIEQFLYREALLLDTRRWQEWLELFEPQAEFWVPAWKSEHEPTQDPDTELSLIWCQPRTRLAERVTRALSGRSVAAIPLPRTQHAVGNVLVDGNSPQPDGCTLAYANFTVHLYNLKKKDAHVFFGRSEYRLAPEPGASGGTWRIRAKKCVLLNDHLPTLLDFYCV